MGRFRMLLDRRSAIAGAVAAGLLGAPRASAQSVWPEDDCRSPPLPPPNRFGQLCLAVSDRLHFTNGPDPQGLRWAGLHIAEFAGINPARDPMTHAAKKAQHFWLKAQSSLRCNLLGWTETDGHVLKLAVARNNADFVNLATARRWGLWLNGTDETGETVMDFVLREEAKAVASGSNFAPIYQRYRTLLAKHGAKRAADLTEADRPVDPYEVEIRPLLKTWDRACYANEGLAAVKKGELWGYVDTTGRLVIPLQFHGAFAFHGGRAAVHIGNRWGLIDTTGRELVPLRYADARLFNGREWGEFRDGASWIRL